MSEVRSARIAAVVAGVLLLVIAVPVVGAVRGAGAAVEEIARAERSPALGDDPQELHESWGIDVPHDTRVVSHRYGEVGPHGERDEVWELDLPAAERTGLWLPEEFTAPLAGADRTTAESVAAGAAVPNGDLDFESLTCKEKLVQDGDDVLVACIDPSAEEYVLFERFV
ncbi:hypothetical protein NLU66_05335 [Brachybacterium sp. NBEC-018]|uniref:hypothetical protein n=1 Tax=Brachybacterium sp. NBEC-018 TaxID=2996004 RepID=UPI002174EABF|nr:hypothetical protein [Brachybacterium sp. NBEC-018]UVY85024.1 hypothetical protein NLU66_05335 [Brachybacterium sp. NBEC-018]